MINEPRLLLADEPTGNLDSANGMAILKLLLSLREDHRITLVIATHDPSVAAHCERYIRLRDGRLIEDQAIVDGDLPDSMFA
jgi:putative ABC transport system ATP-binding protein